MGSHRAEGPARSRRRATPAPAAAPSRGRRRAEPSRTPSWVQNLPQVGVVGVLGLATIVAPLAGDVLLDDPVAVAEAGDGAEQATASAPVMDSDFRVVLPVMPDDAAPPASVANANGEVMTAEQLTELRAAAEQATRDYARSVLPGCDGVVTETGAQNGRLDTGDLCTLWDGRHLLRADAAVTLARLNVGYENTFGEPLCLTDSYRSYASQVRLRSTKPGLAARAGTSEHGWGLAVDLCGGVERAGDRYDWLRANAPEFGWDNPEWARSGGSGPYEPWHWEFAAGQG